MCTLSLFRTSSGYQLFMNRDERHDRTAEYAPRMIDTQYGIFGPVDPPSAGTWIAHNKRGHWACLLNGYFEHSGATTTPERSRGQIILDVLRAEDPISHAAQLEPHHYASFRLVVGTTTQHALFVWDGTEYGPHNFHRQHHDSAFFLTSSSWQQERVIPIRTQQFTDWANSNTPSSNIPAYHLSQQPDQQSAIFMQRSYSQTQSITAITASATGSKMGYWRVPENGHTLDPATLQHTAQL